MKTLALFDFDETLYKKDSLLEFTKFYKGNVAFYTGIFILSPFLIAMKLGLISNEKTKKKYISYFYKKDDYIVFKNKASLFSKTKIEQNLDSKLYSKFLNHVNLNHDIYIVTASFSEWISPWSASFNIPVIGTKLAISNSKITGDFASKNCNGAEKVIRIKEVINLNQYAEIIVYGSGTGDLEMISLAKKVT